MKKPRDIIIDLLLRIELGGAYSDRVLASHEFDAFESRDRGFIREGVHGVLRCKLRLDRIIDTYYNKPAESLSPPIRMILRLGLYQLLFMSVPAHAAVYESVKMASAIQGRGAGGLVNALLRRFLREGEPAWPDDAITRISLEQSYPEWLVARWIREFGDEETLLILHAGNAHHPVFIYNTAIDVTDQELARSLDDAGFGGNPIQCMTGYIEVREAEDLFSSSLFKAGRFIAQDPAAGMAAELLDPLPGMRVIDLCAAPGGKTVNIAVRMRNSGMVTALDMHPGRSRLVRETVTRLGLQIVETVTGDARSFIPADGIPYDRVLLDAPCSGTAVFSKRPDMKWRRREDDFSRLAVIQTELLEHAASLLGPDGILVYSTCTLEKEENDDVIGSFLERNPDFESITSDRFDAFRSEFGYLIPPHRMGGTGAYAAKLRRKQP